MKTFLWCHGDFGLFNKKYPPRIIFCFQETLIGPDPRGICYLCMRKTDNDNNYVQRGRDSHIQNTQLI